MALNNINKRLPCKTPQSELTLKTQKDLAISSRDQYELLQNKPNQGIRKRQQSEIYIVDPTQQQSEQYNLKGTLNITDLISKKRGFSVDHVKQQVYSKIKTNTNNNNQYTLSTENLACFAPTYNTNNTSNYDSSIQICEAYAIPAAGVNISRQLTNNIKSINQKIGQNNGSFEFMFSRGSLKRDDAINNSKTYSKSQLQDQTNKPIQHPQETGFYHYKKKPSITVKQRLQIVKADQHISSYDYQSQHSQSYWDDLEECISSSLPPISLQIDQARKKPKPNLPKIIHYRPLQDPDKILQCIESKELGFDTTEDVISAVELAEKNTYNLLGHKKRAQLCPPYHKEYDEKQKEILHQCKGGQILKLNMGQNVDKNDEIKGYVEKQQNSQLEAEHQAYLRESNFQDSPSYSTTQVNLRPPSRRNNSQSSMGRQPRGSSIQKENSLRRNQREKQAGQNNIKNNNSADLDCFYEEKLENRQFSRSIKEAAADSSSLNRIRKNTQPNKIRSNEKAMTKIARLIHQIQSEDPVT